MIQHCKAIIIDPVTTWANEMNFGMNHAPGAGSIYRPIDQYSPVLYHCTMTDLSSQLQLLLISSSVIEFIYELYNSCQFNLFEHQTNLKPEPHSCFLND